MTSHAISRARARFPGKSTDECKVCNAVLLPLLLYTRTTNVGEFFGGVECLGSKPFDFGTDPGDNSPEREIFNGSFTTAG